MLDSRTTRFKIAPLRGVTLAADRRDLHAPADQHDVVSIGTGRFEPAQLEAAVELRLGEKRIRQTQYLVCLRQLALFSLFLNYSLSNRWKASDVADIFMETGMSALGRKRTLQ
jgi:hypothetical protein